MKPNLDTLKTEIEEYLEESGLALFYGHSRALDAAPVVEWDCDQYPDFRQFVKTALMAEAKVIVFHQREFSSALVEDALEELASCDMVSPETEELERKLNDLQDYAGSVCVIELSFDYGGRVFVFDLRTEWYDEFTQILDEIHWMAGSEEEDDSPISGYFSKN